MLTPHRSLCPTGFLMLMALLGGFSFVAGMVFLLAGAWPVFGFLGLDVLLVYWAFRANYRAARGLRGGHGDAVGADACARSATAARSREWTLNPVWARLDREMHEEFGLLRLFLVSRGRRLSVAGFLSPQEKESFAAALVGARWAKRSAGRRGRCSTSARSGIGWERPPFAA